jgi:hypothetical protein
MMSFIEEDEQLRDTHYSYFRGRGREQMVSRNNADIDGARAACVRRGAQVAGWFVFEGGTDFLNVGGRSIFRCSWDFASCGGASACQHG